MVRTRVGYAGGSRNDPDYHNLGDHTECLRVEYAPETVTCEELLQKFWDRHEPTRQPPMTQYENVLLYENDHQRKHIDRSISRNSSLDPASVCTRIEPLDNFYPAEDYHQNYYLRSDPHLKGFVEESRHDLNTSSLATKLNALAGNDLTSRDLVDQLHRYGFDSTILQQLTPESDSSDPGRDAVNP